MAAGQQTLQDMLRHARTEFQHITADPAVQRMLAGAGVAIAVGVDLFYLQGWFLVTALRLVAGILYTSTALLTLPSGISMSSLGALGQSIGFTLDQALRFSALLALLTVGFLMAEVRREERVGGH